MATDDAVTVRTLLAAIGIEPPEDEVDEMIKSYPALRAAADSLHSPEVARFVPSFSTADAGRASSHREAK